MEILLKILAVIVLVLLNGFFVAAEFAIIKIRDTQLEALVAEGHRRARTARYILNNLDGFLSACQLGITLASLGLGWVGEPVFMALLNPILAYLNVDVTARPSIAFAVGFSILTFLHIVAGEQDPKWLAIQRALAVTLWTAKPLNWFYRISYPFIWLLNNAAQWLLRQCGLEPVSEAELAHSEDELRLLFTTSQKHAGASSFSRDIVLNALDLRHRIVREVMRPRKEIVGLDTEASIAECLEIAEKTRFSRFPLCEEGNLDKTLGIVHYKDLFAMRLKTRSGRELIPVTRKIIYVPETARLEKLLHLFLERRLHFAIVVDEYGGTVGMVTLENILEELVGQIQDEFDQEKPQAIKLGDGAWEVAGTLPLRELEELMGQDLRADEVSTASGWVTHRLGGFPKVGDVVTMGAYQVRVEELDGMAVGRLKIKRLAAVEDVSVGPRNKS